MATTSIRVDRVLWEAAEMTGARSGLSAPEQIERWARLGRELELSPTVTVDEIERMLTARRSDAGSREGYSNRRPPTAED